jgi:hypothetical protein
MVSFKKEINKEKHTDTMLVANSVNHVYMAMLAEVPPLQQMTLVSCLVDPLALN